MTHHEQTTGELELVQLILEHGLDGMRPAMEMLLNMAMKTERDGFLGAKPDERSSDRTGYANGYKPKTLNTSLGKLELEIPQTRGTDVPFYPDALERAQRSEKAFLLAVATMYVQGVATRRVTKVLKNLCGTSVSSSMVSRASQELDEQLQAWRERQLSEVVYLQLDARYEKVRVNGTSTSCAVLVATVVLPDGKRVILGVSVSYSEAEVHWREFLTSLKRRGLHGIKMVTSDSHEGLKAALRATFSGVPWQRCQFHLQQNAGAYVPRKADRPELAERIRSIFAASDLEEAQRKLNILIEEHRESNPKLATWLEHSLPEGFTVFSFPRSHRRRLRTNNMVERLNKELRRRTRIIGVFPNEESLLRLVSAITMEISDDWETGKVYLTLTSE